MFHVPSPMWILIQYIQCLDYLCILRKSLWMPLRCPAGTQSKSHNKKRNKEQKSTGMFQKCLLIHTSPSDRTERVSRHAMCTSNTRTSLRAASYPPKSHILSENSACAGMCPAPWGAPMRDTLNPPKLLRWDKLRSLRQWLFLYFSSSVILFTHNFKVMC